MSNVTIGKKCFKNGKSRTYLKFSSGKKVMLTQEEAHALSEKLNFHLKNGHKQIKL